MNDLAETLMNIGQDYLAVHFQLIDLCKLRPGTEDLRLALYDIRQRLLSAGVQYNDREG